MEKLHFSDPESESKDEPCVNMGCHVNSDMSMQVGDNEPDT